MSDDMQTVVRLDAGAGESDELARRLTELLVGRGIIVANLERDEITQPSAWRAGPAAASVLEGDVEVDSALANSGVDIVIERELHSPDENYEPPTCGGCGLPYDADQHFAVADAWLAGDEPTLSCEMCGWSAPAGDWPGEFVFAVGAPAVVFNNWPPLTKEFLADLRALLGGRTRVVLSHY